jgi:DNA-binding response OmpR family regulator
MARILIVENDRVVAMWMARILREAGHTPILAPDAHAAFQELVDRPDLVLLALGLPDLPGGAFLRHLRSQAETAQIPVVVLTGHRKAPTRLRDSEIDGVAAILVKPTSGSQLRQVVDRVLAGTNRAPDPGALRGLQERQRELILRLIIEGSDTLAFHVARRLSADRTGPKSRGAARALTWAEIASWGTREGLLDEEEARLLQYVPLAEPQNERADCA